LTYFLDGDQPYAAQSASLESQTFRCRNKYLAAGGGAIAGAIFFWLRHWRFGGHSAQQQLCAVDDRDGSKAASANIEPRGSYTPNDGHGSATR
jgi:hypothetical protein